MSRNVERSPQDPSPSRALIASTTADRPHSRQVAAPEHRTIAFPPASHRRLDRPAAITEHRLARTATEALTIYSYFLRAFFKHPALAHRADRLLHTTLHRRLGTQHQAPPTDRLRIDRIA